MKMFLDEFGGEINAVLISHAHMDHFDPAAVVSLFEIDPEIELYAPYPVTDWLRASSIGNSSLTKYALPVEWHGEYNIEGNNDELTIYIMPNSGIEMEPHPYRVGFLIVNQEGKGVFLPGDSHKVGDWDIRKDLVSDIVTWGSLLKKDLLEYFADSPNLEHIWLIHWEDFAPGNFDCSDNPDDFIQIVEKAGIHGGTLSYHEWTKL